MISRLYLAIILLNGFSIYGQKPLIEATCSDQTIAAFTSAMDLGAHAVHLHVVAENAQFKLTSGVLLSDIIIGLEWYTKSFTRYEIKYIVNLQKSPTYTTDSKALYELLDSYIPMSRVTIRSKDYKTLKYWKKNYPKVKLAAVANTQKSIGTNLANLGFKPTFYCVDHKSINETQIENLHKRSIEVAPWTLNDTTIIRTMNEWQVDRIVTDSIRLTKELGLNMRVKNGTN